MKKLFFLCAFMLTFINTNAQKCNYTFKGQITDFHDSTPIIGASVYIKNLNKYTVSDEQGNFTIENLCSGKLEVEIQHVACESKLFSLTLNKDTFKKIVLEHHLKELNEVIVKGSSKTDKTSVEKSIKKTVIENFTDKSLGDALNTISGVSSLNTGNSIVKPMIHGLHSSRLLLINNNVRLFDQEWGDEHAPNIDINSSDRIDVIKGANSLKYGSDAIGGLILIRSKKYALLDSLFGKSILSMNSNGYGGNVNTEIIKTYTSGHYAKLQMNYKVFGDFKTPEYNLTNSGLQSKNASVRVGYNGFDKGYDAYYSFVHNEFGILKSSHIGNVNDLVQAINNPEPRVIDDFSYNIGFPKQRITHHLGKIELYKQLNGLGKLSLQYDFQINRRKEFDVRRGSLANTPVIDLRLFTTSIQPDLMITSFENFKLNVGLNARYQQNNAVSGTGVRPLIPDFEKFDIAAYSIGNYTLNETNEFNFGFRYDHSKIEARKWYNRTDWEDIYNYDELFPEFETGVIDGTRIETTPNFSFHNLSASFGYLKRIDNNLSFLFNYGLANRVPNPSEFFSDGLHHSAARIEYGLLTMENETANKLIVSLEKKDTDFGFEISPYYKHIDGFIQLIPTGITTTIRGAFPVWEYRQTNAEIFGVDIDVNKKITNTLSYNGNFSVLKGTNTQEDIPLIHMPAANFGNQLTYVNENLNQLSISLGHKTVLQQKRFPDYNFFTYNALIQDDVYVDISSTPPTYSLFNLNASAVFEGFGGGDVKLELNVENLFNTKYREHLNRLRYFADELGRNINLKIKINY